MVHYFDFLFLLVPKILVVAGYTRGHYTRKTEIWSQPETRCTLPRFPLNTYGALGFWTAQGPTVCGGHVSESGGGKKCFVLNKEHQWMPIPSLTTDRVYASATEVNNDETLIIGGTDENYNALKTTELISSSGSVKGKDFPTTIARHCTIKINETHALVTGGVQDGSYSASTWFVDLTTTTFTPGPPMKMKRLHYGCTTFNLGTKTFGIVSGGQNNENRLDSTEIIDLDENHPTWTEGMRDKSKKSLSLTNVFFLLIFRSKLTETIE